MIFINVLPENLRPVKRTPLPHIISVAVLLLAIAGTLGYYVQLTAAVGAEQAKQADIEAQLVQKREVVADFNRLTDQKLALQARIETIEDISAGRIIWSRALHRLTELMPENIWLTRVRVVNRTRTRVMQVTDPQTGEVTSERQRVTLPFLEISGNAVRDDRGDFNTAPFTNATAEDPEFSERFRFDRPSIEPATFEGFEVRSFIFEYEIRTPAPAADDEQEDAS